MFKQDDSYSIALWPYGFIVFIRLKENVLLHTILGPGGILQELNSLMSPLRCYLYAITVRAGVKLISTLSESFLNRISGDKNQGL